MFAYDFGVDFGGCVMAYTAGQYYHCSSGSCSPLDGESHCECIGSPEAKWYKSPSEAGQICKRRDGWFCDVNVKEGVYDPEDDDCIICSNKIQI